MKTLKIIGAAVVLLFVLGAIFGQDDADVGSDDSAGAAEADEPDPPPTPDRKVDDDDKASAGTKKQQEKVREPATENQRERPRRRTYLVTHVVDGDTIDLANGERVRLVGIDTPETGDCHSQTATRRVEQLVLGKRVRLGESDEDRDRYDRLLRYVDVGDVDVGLRLIREGLAIARYDSRDGYGFHPREPRYVAWDRKRPERTCAPEPQPFAQPPAAGCAEGYSPCVPPYPPDVNCADVDGPVRVTGSDPHGLDGDGDGVACE